MRLSREEHSQLEAIKTGVQPWMEWVRERKALEERAASTVVNWETKLRGLAAWYGSDFVGTITRKEANAYKLHMKESGMSANSIEWWRSLRIDIGPGLHGSDHLHLL